MTENNIHPEAKIDKNTFVYVIDVSNFKKYVTENQSEKEIIPLCSLEVKK